MFHVGGTAAVLVVMLMAAASPMAAQQQRPSVLIRPELAAGTARLERATWPPTTAEQGAASAGRYIAVGAVIGALATAGGLALYAGQAEEDVVMSPLALVPVVLGGAALGGGVGYVVFRASF